MIDVTLIDNMGSDLTVVNAARVSFNKKSEWDEDNTLTVSDSNLISYLAMPVSYTHLTLPTILLV